MEEHDAAVQAISKKISVFSQQQTPYRLYHGSTNSTQARKVDPLRMVDTSKLNHVFKIDRQRRTCLVEPNVPMDQLVDELLPHGLLPLVVMEFPGITVGGGFAGTAGESSGFKYGFFENTINWIEIVLPTGEIVHASKDERSDLFHGAAGTFGTLGVTTLLEMRLIDSKAYVELTYHPTEDAADTLATMQLATDDVSNDYVDGIMLSSSRGVIVAGKLTNATPSGTNIQHFSRAQDPWFYVHADRLTRRNVGPLTELTPIRDYLFRYDRGAFWTGRYAFKYFLTPFNRVTRWALDYFMHTRVMYRALHFSGHAAKYMIQDLLLPATMAEDFLHHVDATLGFYPLWLCPFRVEGEVSLRPRLPANTHSFVNIGVWGPGSNDYAAFVAANRRLEHKVRALGGIKWLYAQAYYTEAEFWAIYDREWYEALRQRYGASYLPNVFEKVRVDLSRLERGAGSWTAWARQTMWNVWPVSGVYGVLKTLYEREYLLERR